MSSVEVPPVAPPSAERASDTALDNQKEFESREESKNWLSKMFFEFNSAVPMVTHLQEIPKARLSVDLL